MTCLSNGIINVFNVYVWFFYGNMRPIDNTNYAWHSIFRIKSKNCTNNTLLYLQISYLMFIYTYDRVVSFCSASVERRIYTAAKCSFITFVTSVIILDAVDCPTDTNISCANGRWYDPRKNLLNEDFI